MSDYLSVSDFAQKVGVSRQAIYKQLKKGKFDKYGLKKADHIQYIHKDALQEYKSINDLTTSTELNHDSTIIEPNKTDSVNLSNQSKPDDKPNLTDSIQLENQKQPNTTDVEQPNSTNNESESSAKDELIAILRQQIKVKDEMIADQVEQIKLKDAQINNQMNKLNELLEHNQRLLEHEQELRMAQEKRLMLENKTSSDEDKINIEETDVEQPKEEPITVPKKKKRWIFWK